MNITVYNNRKDKQYNLRYIPSFRRVLEGSFYAQDEMKNDIWLSDDELFDILDSGIKNLRKSRECSSDSRVHKVEET